MHFIGNIKNNIKKKLDFNYGYQYIPLEDHIHIVSDGIELDTISPDSKFSFSNYSKTIANMIYGSKQKFSVGIYGDWGTGKTTLMKMIEKDLKPVIFKWADEQSYHFLNKFLMEHFNQFNLSWVADNKWTQYADMLETSNGKNKIKIIIDKNASTAALFINSIPVYEFLIDETSEGVLLRENHILTIWFDAWRYQLEEGFATTALMKTIAYAMGRHIIFKDIKPIILRGLSIVTKDILRNVATKYIMTKEGVVELEKNFTQKMEQLAEIDRDTIYFDGLKIIEEKIKQILNKNPESRVVVFVDDLDRCSDETALEVFESIKVFLDIEGFVFIIGLSRTMMDKLINNKFKDLNVSSEEYFRKIIQIEVRIPKWEISGIRTLVERLLNELIKNSKLNIIPENQNGNKQLIEMVTSGKGTALNPRYVKQIINRLVLLKSSNPDLESQKILINEVIYTRWRNIYEYLEDPNFNLQFRDFIESNDKEKRIEESKIKLKQKDFQPDDFQLFLSEVGTDKELYNFLVKFKDTILDIEKESEEGKGWKKYKEAAYSSLIPVNSPLNQEEIDFFNRLDTYLDKSDIIFTNHITQRKRLLNLLFKNHPNIVKKRDIEDLLEEEYENMNEQEKEEFMLLKETTYDMNTYNSLIFKLLDENKDKFQEVPELEILYEHYKVWLEKFKEKFEKPNVAIIYVGSGTKENKPFPYYIRKVIARKIFEIENQINYNQTGQSI